VLFGILDKETKRRRKKKREYKTMSKCRNSRKRIEWHTTAHFQSRFITMTIILTTTTTTKAEK